MKRPQIAFFLRTASAWPMRRFHHSVRLVSLDRIASLSYTDKHKAHAICQVEAK